MHYSFRYGMHFEACTIYGVAPTKQLHFHSIKNVRQVFDFTLDMIIEIYLYSLYRVTLNGIFLYLYELNL